MSKKGRKTQTSYINNSVFVIILVTFTVLINIFAYFIQNRYAPGTDLSDGRIYTLTEQTQHVLKNLQNDIILYPIYSPGNQNNVTMNIIRRYAAASSNIQVKEPTNNVLTTVFDSANITQSGILVTNQDHTIWKFIPESELYEVDDDFNSYEIKTEGKITSAIEGVIAGSFSKVKLLSGHGEAKQSEYRSFLQMLDQKNFDVESYSFLESEESLNPQSDILVVISPRSDLTESEYTRLVEYCSKGGRILFFWDNAIYSEREDSEKKTILFFNNDLPYFNLLTLQFGLEVNSDFILSNDPLSTNLRASSLYVLPKTHAITLDYMNDTNSYIFSECSSISRVINSNGTVSTTTLLVTDSSCYSKQISRILSYSNDLRQGEQDQTGSFIVGAVSEWGDARMILFTDSSSINDAQYQIEGNRQLMESVIDYLSPTGVYTGVSAKSFTSKIQINLNQILTLSILMINVVLLPVLIVYYGLRKK